jgi:acyl-ACP thioesterase
MDPSLPQPTTGRTFAARRRVRLSDIDAYGRVRLDAIARFLQDVAIDDVQETGWGLPSHLWFVRRIRVDVLRPFLLDQEVELVTWCSAVGSIAAGRRWSVKGGVRGHVEVDSVWIHLGPDQRPARIDGFGVYAEAAGGRAVSTRLELPDPPSQSMRRPWALRWTDVDRHGHVNNAAYWQAVEHVAAESGFELRQPYRAMLDFREPIDLGEALELTEHWDGPALTLGFSVDGIVRAVARVEPVAAPPRKRRKGPKSDEEG